MYKVHAQSACAQSTCTKYMHKVHAQSTCTKYMHKLHVMYIQSTCNVKYKVFVKSICTKYIVKLHVLAKILFE